MKRVMVLGILSLMILLCTIPECPAKTIGTIYLKNAETIKGTIIELIPENSLSIKATNGKQYEFPFDFVARIKVLESSAQSKSDTIDAIQLKGDRTIYGYIDEININQSVKIRTIEDNFYEYPFDSIVKIYAMKFTLEIMEEEYRGSRKSPALALTLSLFFPSAGQFYNGHTGKGVICLAIGIGGSLAFWTGVRREARSVLGEEEEGEGLISLGLLMILPTWIYSMGDAYFSAQSINKKRNYAFYEFEMKDNVALAFTPSIKDRLEFKPGLRLTYRF